MTLASRFALLISCGGENGVHGGREGSGSEEENDDEGKEEADDLLE